MRRPHSSNDHARRAPAPISSFAIINLSIPTHIRTQSPNFARYGAANQPSLLTTQGHTQSTYVSAPVEGTQTNRMFTRRQRRKVDGILLQPAVGNSIIRKQRRPRRTVQAEVGLFDFAGCVSYVKQSSIATTRRPESAQNRRSVIDVNGFAQTFSRQRLAEWIIRRVCRNYLDDVAWLRR